MQLLLVTFWDMTARNGPSIRTHTRNTEKGGQTDVEFEIVI